jgi:Trypsin
MMMLRVGFPFTVTIAVGLMSAVLATGGQRPPGVDPIHIRRRQSSRELGPISNIIQNIVGGSNVTAAIKYFVKLAQVDGSVKCGGSLIASDMVLTAAHCIQDNSSAPIVWPNTVFIACR